MFCLSMEPDHLHMINKIGYIPVGLGNKNFNNEWFTDRGKENISSKNQYYGEYTFHYWIWKNHINKLEDKWIGFCQYRKFWTKKENTGNNLNFSEFNNLLIKEINLDNNNYESIIGEPFYVDKFKPTKFLKKNFKKILLSPAILFNKNKRTIKFHFDLMHGEGNLEKAIEILDVNDRNDFNNFVNSKNFFNPHNMFICKSPKILEKYYKAVFPWLKECEKIFGFEKLQGYGMKRIYGFLAERYLSFWFQKYTKYKTMPIYFKDLSDYNYKDL